MKRYTRISNIVGCGKIGTVEDIRQILDWIDEWKEECEIDDIRLPDYLSIGDKIRFIGANNAQFYLTTEGFEYLTPASGESDSIDVRIYDSSKVIVAEGSIDIAYGYTEVDSDGGVGNGSEESIDFRTTDFVEKLKEICNELEAFVEEKETTVKQIKGALGFEPSNFRCPGLRFRRL